MSGHGAESGLPVVGCPMCRERGSRCNRHEFTEDVDDASMCVCGIPALTHDAVFPPSGGAQ